MTDLCPPQPYIYDNGRRGLNLPACGIRIEQAPESGIVTITPTYGDTVRLRMQDVEALIALLIHHTTREESIYDD